MEVEEGFYKGEYVALQIQFGFGSAETTCQLLNGVYHPLFGSKKQRVCGEHSMKELIHYLEALFHKASLVADFNL